MISDRTSFYDVALSVSAACTTLIPHLLLKSSGIVFECRSFDKKYRGCLISVGFFGGSSMVSM